MASFSSLPRPFCKVHRLCGKANPDLSSDMAGWTWGHIAVIGFLALLILGTVVINWVANLRKQEREQWPTTTGVPIDTRVEEIPQRVSQTIRGPMRFNIPWQEGATRFWLIRLHGY